MLAKCQIAGPVTRLFGGSLTRKGAGLRDKLSLESIYVQNRTTLPHARILSRTDLERSD